MTYLLLGLATTGAAIVFYLTTANQQWLRQPLPAACRHLAALSLLVVIGAWMWALDSKAGFFAALVLLMLLLGLFPLLSLLKPWRENNGKA